MEQTVQDTFSDRMQKCVVCQEISTTARGENREPLCASCSNDQYFDKLKRGEIVELKIDMRKVRGSTLMAINAMIQRDIEDYTTQQSPLNQEGK